MTRSMKKSMKKSMKSPPREIWLQWGEAEITWCDSPIDDTDVKYVICEEEAEEEAEEEGEEDKDEQKTRG